MGGVGLGGASEHRQDTVVEFRVLLGESVLSFYQYGLWESNSGHQAYLNCPKAPSPPFFEPSVLKREEAARKQVYFVYLVCPRSQKRALSGPPMQIKACVCTKL